MIIQAKTIELAPNDKAKFEDLAAPQGELLREVVLEIIPDIHDRIHHDGIAADGTQIGTYSNSYMAVRSGSFQNTTTFKKGKNAGKNKDAGTTTKGANQGQARQRYNRGSDTKVILSLTRQMENDYALIAGEVGWGVGFNNSHNFDKATWNNDRYGHRVYDLTEDEEKKVVELTENLITERFK